MSTDNCPNIRGNLKEILDENQHNHQSNLFYTLENKKKMWEKRLNQKYINGVYYLNHINSDKGEYTPISEIPQNITNTYFNIDYSYEVTTDNTLGFNFELNNPLTQWQYNNLQLNKEYTDKELLENNTVLRLNILKNNTNNGNLKLYIPTDTRTSHDYIYTGTSNTKWNIVNQELNVTIVKPTRVNDPVKCTIKLTGNSVFPVNSYIEGWLNYSYGKYNPQTPVHQIVSNNNTNSVSLNIPHTSSSDNQYTVRLYTMQSSNTIYLGDTVTGNIT